VDRGPLEKRSFEENGERKFPVGESPDESGETPTLRLEKKVGRYFRNLTCFSANQAQMVGNGLFAAIPRRRAAVRRV